MNWRQYEQQIFDLFKKLYPEGELLFDQQVEGRHSRILRQVDILIRYRIVDIDAIAAFDCKCYERSIDVQTIDYMVGYLEDLGARIGGIVTTKGFSEGAKNRASAAQIDLRTIEFQSVEKLVEQFVPSLDFSDPRNSMYIPLL